MKLKDFERYIDGVIVERGLSYYESGNIVSLECEGGEWNAVVEGSGMRSWRGAMTIP